METMIPNQKHGIAAIANGVISVDLRRAALRSETIPSTWDEAKITYAIDRYSRFLRLAAASCGEAIAPTRDVDLMWHLHMLHPVAYHRDCMRLFGEILDHDGGFGAEPDEEPELERVFRATAAKWKALYGEDYVRSEEADARSVACKHDCKGRCWHACKTVQ